MTISMLAIDLKQYPPQFGYNQVLHTVFAAFDSIVTVVISHFITTAWIPSCLSRRIKFLLNSNIKSSSNVNRVDPHDETAGNGALGDSSKKTHISQSQNDVQLVSKVENSSVY